MIYKRCGDKGRDRDRCVHEWYGSYQIRGTPRVRVSLAKWLGKKVESKSAAVAAYDLLKQDLRDGVFKPEGRGVVKAIAPSALTLQLLVDSYEKDHVKAKQQPTAEDYPYRTKPIIQFFGATTALDSFTNARIQEFQANRRQLRLFPGEFAPRPPSKAYINRPVSLLRTLLLWALDRKMINFRPKVKLDKEDYTRWVRVTPAIEAKLLEVTTGTRLQPLIVIALDTGMRQGEMLKLLCGDLDLIADTVTPRGSTTKAGKHRTIPFSTRRLKETLEWFLGDRASDPNAPLFDNGYGKRLTDLSRDWENCRLRAFGYPVVRDKKHALTLQSRQALQSINLHWHDLRHEFACRLDDRGVALGVIQQLLGHADIKTTERYLRRGAKDLQAGAVRLDDGTRISVELPKKVQVPAEDNRLNQSDRPNVSQLTH